MLEGSVKRRRSNNRRPEAWSCHEVGIEHLCAGPISGGMLTIIQRGTTHAGLISLAHIGQSRRAHLKLAIVVLDVEVEIAGAMVALGCLLAVGAERSSVRSHQTHVYTLGESR